MGNAAQVGDAGWRTINLLQRAVQHCLYLFFQLIKNLTMVSRILTVLVLAIVALSANVRIRGFVVDFVYQLDGSFRFELEALSTSP